MENQSFLCEYCGTPVEGKVRPCGVELCEDCCKDCYQKDGFCDEIDRM